MKSFGTEGRKNNPDEEIAPSNELYDYIIFRGSDVKDLRKAANEVFLEDAKRIRSDGRVGPSGRLEIDYMAMSHPDTMATISDDEMLSFNIGAILSAAMIVSPLDPHGVAAATGDVARVAREWIGTPV